MRELPTGSDGRGPGRIVITLDRAAGEVCYRIQLSSGAAPTNGEIRDKDSGEAVVALFAGPDLTSVVSGTDGGGGQAYEGRACRNGIKSETIDAILDRPERYSVNVFNERFPGKALQGDLAAG